MLLKQLLVVLIVGVSICGASIDDASQIDDAENNTDYDDDYDDDDDDDGVSFPDVEAFPDEDDYENEDYWQDGYWDLPDSDRLCREGQMLESDGSCVDCPAGCYNQDWLRVDVCMPCEVGSYTNKTGSTECDWCPGVLTTDYTGSTNYSDCQEKSVRLEAAYLTTVHAYVSVTGDLCSSGIADFLWGISNLQFYEASFTQCSYDEMSDVSSMSLKITPPTRYGMEVYGIFSIVAGHRQMLNAYIPLGHYYAEKAFDMMSNSAMMEWFGLNMDIDQLNIDDFEIVSFEAAFEDTCSPGYSLDESSMCVESSADSSADSSDAIYASYNIYYNMTSPICSTNAGQTMSRNFVEEWNFGGMLPYSCVWDGGCTAHFMFCESDGASSTLAMKIDVHNDGPLEAYCNEDSGCFDSDWDISNMTDEWQILYMRTEEACSNGVEVVNSQLSCLDSCESGQYLDAAGFCVNCPFTTWSDDNQGCNSCPWYTETPFWGMDSEDMCVETENWWRDEMGDTEYLRDMAGRLNFSISLAPSIDFCGIASAKQGLDDMCSELFGEELEADAESAEIESLQKLVCWVSGKLGYYYEEVCGDDFDMSFQDALDRIDFDEGESILDLVCAAVKPMYDMEDEDLSDDCAGIDNNVIDISFDFDGQMESEDGGSILVPMLAAMKNLETMDFSSAGRAMENFMERFGMYDMNALTGLDIANNIRSMIVAMPGSLDMQQFDFDVVYDEADYFCDSGDVKRECSYCSMWDCQKTDADYYKELSCEMDECDNCATTYYYYNATSSSDELFECASCDFPDVIDNGYKFQDYGTSAYYACNSGYKLQDCSNYAWCDVNNPEDASMPECVEDTCVFDDEIENGYKSDSWDSDSDWEGCPWARYLCNDGYEIADSNYASCYSSDNTASSTEMSYPTCQEVCTFPEWIDNGWLVANYSSWDGKWQGEYECEDGSFTDGNAYCSQWQQNEDGEWEESMYVPECMAGATCEFPAEVNGAEREDTWEDSSSGQKYAYYDCEDGYRAEGPTSVECDGEDRDEFNPEFLCIDEDNFCWYDYNAVDNGYVYRQDNNAYWYKCSDSYEMEGDERAWCDDDGNANYPMCVEIEPECDLPDWIENGWVSEDHGDSKYYECQSWDGWKIEGDGWAYCNGTETVNYPECVAFTCDFDQYIENGNLSSTDDKGINGWYYCYDGYRFEDGDSHASCDADGNYEYPVCMENGDPCEWPAIDNGNLVYYEDYSAYYNCSANYSMEGSWHATCYDGEVTYLPECQEYYPCDFPDEIENGWLADDWESGARYECEDNYRCKDWDCYVWCDTSMGSMNKEPECEESDDDSSCDWPDIDDGYMSESWDSGAMYQCNDGYSMDGSQEVWCNDAGEMGDIPSCYWDDGDDDDGDDDGDDEGCKFDQYIDMGYMVWQGDWTDDDEGGYQLAMYRCYAPYAMQNIDVDNGKSYFDMYGVGYCYEKDGEMGTMLPSCQDAEAVGYCGLPMEIENGGASNMTWEDDTLWGEYYCHDEYMMIETMNDRGNWGWCRSDGSMNLPRCVSSDEYFNIEFSLDSNGYNNGYYDNGGYVLAKWVTATDEYEWEMACDDGSNDNAAGAVCRSLGYMHGKSITPHKKMKALEDYGFGWINVDCGYDDTFMTSSSCSADKYGDGTALCSSSEQWAVECFDTKWSVESTLAVNTKNGKMQCNLEMWKEDSLVSAKGMDLWAEFGAMNGTENVMFAVETKDKASSKGYKSIAKDKTMVKNSGYSCFYCKIGSGDMELGMAWDGEC